MNGASSDLLVEAALLVETELARVGWVATCPRFLMSVLEKVVVIELTVIDDERRKERRWVASNLGQAQLPRTFLLSDGRRGSACI